MTHPDCLQSSDCFVITECWLNFFSLVKRSEKLMLTCLKRLTESMQFVHSRKVHASDDRMETLLHQLVGFLLTFNEFVSPRTVESICTDIQILTGLLKQYEKKNCPVFFFIILVI